MSESNEPPDSQDQSSDSIGGIAEEAAKLAASLVDWVKEAAESTAAGVPNLHIATGAEECTVCPICQVLHILRGAKPEVFDHLKAAAFSLMLAARAALDTEPDSPGGRRGPVESIDISFTETDA